jgi:hypothetical protein
MIHLRSWSTDTAQEKGYLSLLSKGLRVFRKSSRSSLRSLHFTQAIRSGLELFLKKCAKLNSFCSARMQFSATVLQGLFDRAKPVYARLQAR